MTSFAWGALGAFAVLATLALVRRLVWLARFRRWRGRGPFGLRFLFARLGTRPEQEQVITAEAEALFRDGRALREDLFAARAELADLLSAPALDAAMVSAALDRRLEKVGALRARLADGLARLHGALDVEQRARLAALVRSGLRGHGGHRRHAHGRC